MIAKAVAMSRGSGEEPDLTDEEARRQKILSIWSPSPPAPRRVRGPLVVNVLALCGVVIGIASIFCPWFWWDFTVGTWSTSLWEFLTPEGFAINHLDDLGGLLFISATIAALFTQISGSIQIAGLAMVFIDVADRAAMGLGFHMGALSAAIILASVAYPIGPGFEAGPCRLRDRLTVIGRKASLPENQDIKGRHPPRLRLGRLIRANGKWISLLVAISIWSATVVSYENDFFRNDPLLTQVEGGFVATSLSFEWAAFSLSGGKRLSLHDGESSVGWNFSNPELTAGKWCAVDLGYRSLGFLNVSLTIVNQNGDDYFGPGDQLIVIARNGTSFVEDIVYSMSLIYCIDPPFGIVISFAFHDDVLDSWISRHWSGGL
ncbi:MAG: hypothetical protein JSU93_02515 [Methanobacteriota archaeon]|nr:MAG: hypothetical protein JSU93_02515 [Euryarchaeota archaeon]